MRPPPKSKGSATVTPSSLRIAVVPVVISADWISASVQSGWSWRSSALTPATCGLDIEVPLMMP
jgi:hypothetical protein